VGLLAKVVLESIPNEGRGIFTSVEVVCSDNNDIKTFSKHFWLPQSLIVAALRLRDYVHINRVMDVEDIRCTKHVHFRVKAEPTQWFFKIVKTLRDVGVHITATVEAGYVKSSAEVVAKLREAGVEEVEVREVR
jgi:hypothetical protein